MKPETKPTLPSNSEFARSAREAAETVRLWRISFPWFFRNDNRGEL